MKFAKELDDNAVPEWKDQYLDYKNAKKRLKAVQRACRVIDHQSPNNVAPSTLASSLREAPVFSLLHREEQRTDQASETPDRLSLLPTRSRSEASAPRATRDGGATEPTSARSIPTTERSPLRAQQGEVVGKNGKPMRRYGSIIGTPPEVNGLVTVNSPKQHESASLLELPVAALDPEQPKHVQKRDISQVPSYRDRSGSPGSSNGPSSKRHEPPASQLAHTRNAYDVSSPIEPRQQFHARRANTAPDKRPIMQRMFSLSGPRRSSWRQNDVALEAYREFDSKKEEFFSYLDKQLDKVDKFYVEREKEATERLNAIREQLHVLRDRRRDEILAAQEAHEREVARREMSKSSSSLPNGNGNGESERRLSIRPWMAPAVDQAVTHIDNVWDKVRGSYVGTTSKKMDELASPVIPAQLKSASDRQDYVRSAPSKDVPYRAAKKRLKTALAEFYRSLELLKSYALLNRTAFRKINKKYDKAISDKPHMAYMQKVNKRHFVSSEVLEGHIHAVEDLYARYFERGNHKIAISKLRSKISRAEDFTGPIWRQGVMLAAGFVFSVEGIVYGVHDLYEVRFADFTQVSYLLQIYGGYFLMIFLMGFFVFDTRIFEKNKVNYQFVFEFVRPLNWRQLSEVTSYFFFLFGLIMWLNFRHVGGETMYIYWPIVLIALTLVLLFLPPPLLYWKSRSWFLYTNWRLLFAGLYPVEFRDFFIGDMLCSLTYATGNISLFFCLYANRWNNPSVCSSSSSRLLGFFTTLPGIFRALQCLRRYWDTKNVFPHLVNCGKYTFTVLYYMTLSIYRIDHSMENMALFLVFATVNAVYCIVWDIMMDWSLFDFESNNLLLRDTLAFKRKRFYYFAIVFDIIGRFNWIGYVIFKQDVGHASFVAFCVALLEVFRRGLWSIFRVENEHCTNVNRSRAIRDVPLPYAIHESSENLIDKSDQAQEERRQGIRLDNEPANAEHASSSTAGALSLQTTGIDVEHGGGTPSSIRRRPTFNPDSPVLRTLRRVGTTMMAAHAQDYERKRRPDVAAEHDYSDYASSDSDNGKSSKPHPSVRESKKRREREHKDRQKAFDELPEDPQDEDETERRDREDLTAAQDAFTLAHRRE